MRATPLDEIRQAIHGRWLSASSLSPVNVEQATIDTRTAQAGELYFAISGARHDGHDFLAEAAAAGCVSAVVRMETPIHPDLAGRFGGGIIGVADTTAALGELARMHRKRFAGQVIAVTGSVGKTTVKRMIHHILSGEYTGTASPASFNNSIGVPLTLLAAAGSDDYVVCELGTSSPGEIAALARIARPDLAVITGAGPSHLQNLQSVERVAVEKASILSGINDRAVAIVNADCEPLATALRVYDVRTITFGESDQAQLRITGWETDGLTQRFQINDRLWVDLPMPGRHNAANAMAALAVALRFGLDQTRAAAALADFRGPTMRMQGLRIGSVTLLNDAYNANPMSMAAGLAALLELNVRRRVFVAGDMLELGDASAEYHRQLGRQIALAGVNVLVAVGPMAADIADAAADAGLAAGSVHRFDTAAEAAADVGSWLGAGDGVLVKASRGVGAECIAEKIVTAAPELSEA